VTTGNKRYSYNGPTTRIGDYMNTMKCALAGLAAALTIAAGGAAPAAHAATFCNSYGGSNWSNTLCSGPGGATLCNSYGPGIANGGGPFGRPNGPGTNGDWSNTNCS
jgi:hypothetical protein